MFDDIGKAIRKNQKRFTLHQNKSKGAWAEKMFEMGESLNGNKVTRKPHGRDYVVQKTDMWGRPVGRKTDVEIKTGNAKLSKLQKKTKKKNKNYKVVRFNY